MLRSIDLEDTCVTVDWLLMPGPCGEEIPRTRYDAVCYIFHTLYGADLLTNYVVISRKWARELEIEDTIRDLATPVKTSGFINEDQVLVFPNTEDTPTL